MKELFLMVITICMIPMALIIIPFNIVRKLILRQSLRDYFLTIAIGLDQAGGSVLYSQEDFTISSYTYKLCKDSNKFACCFMKFINMIFGKYHCQRSYFKELYEMKNTIGTTNA